MNCTTTSISPYPWIRFTIGSSPEEGTSPTFSDSLCHSRRTSLSLRQVDSSAFSRMRLTKKCRLSGLSLSIISIGQPKPKREQRIFRIIRNIRFLVPHCVHRRRQFERQSAFRAGFPKQDVQYGCVAGAILTQHRPRYSKQERYNCSQAEVTIIRFCMTLSNSPGCA